MPNPRVEYNVIDDYKKVYNPKQVEVSSASGEHLYMNTDGDLCQYSKTSLATDQDHKISLEQYQDDQRGQKKPMLIKES